MKKCYLALLFSFFAGLSFGQIVITEIMYNPPESGTDSLEYIEIFNNSESDINLSGYTFTAGITHTFAETTINAMSYLIIAVDSAVMRKTLGVSALQWDGGGLSNSGETITLENGSGSIVSSVDYDDGNGWPGMADGTDGEGASIELCDPNKDENDPINWSAATNDLGVMINGASVLGTPGGAATADCPIIADVIVEVSSFVFTPRDITINQGETVRWENKGGTHNVNGTTDTYPDNPESFTSGNPSGEAWIYEFTFTKPGFYDYRCDPHFNQDMIGTVTVVDPNQVPPELVITEIMYNDPAMFDSLEFIEILNTGENTVELFGMTFLSGPTFTFPSHQLAPGEIILVAQDSMTFRKYFNMPAFQYEGGGLSSDGEAIILTTSGGDTIDMVSYLDRDPWPLEADGNGYSLILCDPGTDNSDPSNWSFASLSAGFEYEGIPIFADPGSLSYCLISIAMASSTDDNGVALMDGRRAAIEGVVYGGNLRPPGLQFTVIDGSNDGIAVFSSSAQYGYTVAEGDSIRLFGRVDQFNGLTQLIPDTLVLMGQNSTLFEPTIITDLSEATESQLVTIENVSLLDSSEWGGGSSGFNVEVTNGADTFAVRIDSDIDLFTSNYPTGTFNVTGIGGQFDSSSPYFDGYQLLPRNSMDINPFVPFVEQFPERSIAEMTTVDEVGVADSLDRTCTLDAIVYGINQRPSGLQFTIIDEQNNGIGVFLNSGNIGYTVTEGDRITVKGTIDQFNGYTQIIPEEIILDAQGEDLIGPLVVDSLSEATESSLIKMEGMTYVDDTQWAGDGSSFSVEIKDDAGNSFTMRIDNDTELSTMSAPIAPFNVIGIGGQFDSSAPYDEGYQILPRYLADFEATSSNENILDASDINIYPNPVDDLLTIDTDLSIISVELFSLDGQRLLFTQKKMVPMNEFINGIYLLKIKSSEGAIIQKIIKK